MKRMTGFSIGKVSEENAERITKNIEKAVDEDVTLLREAFHAIISSRAGVDSKLSYITSVIASFTLSSLLPLIKHLIPTDEDRKTFVDGFCNQIQSLLEMD